MIARLRPTPHLVDHEEAETIEQQGREPARSFRKGAIT
jgi:hypothetical protein